MLLRIEAELQSQKNQVYMQQKEGNKFNMNNRFVELAAHNFKQREAPTLNNRKAVLAMKLSNSK